MTSILPDNSTQLEFDLEKIFDIEGDIALGINKLSTAKYGGTTPNSYLPYLIWEYNLGEVTEWVNSERDVIERGLAFQRIRGTRAAIQLALDWIDFTPATIEERVFSHWANFQMNTGKIPTKAQIKKIVKLANLAKPVRSRLIRLYYGLDLKPLTFDDSEAGLDMGLFDNFSGVYDEELDVWLSFLDRQSFVLDDSANNPSVTCRATVFVNDQLYSWLNSDQLTDVEYDSEHESLLAKGFGITGISFVQPAQVSTDCQSPDTIVNDLEEILGIGEG